MDHDNRKVFVSGIRRTSVTVKNNLHEITEKDVAQPLAPQIKDDQVQDVICNFIPSNGKFYVPKKKSKLKVLTVRELRTKYEEDILPTLPNELEKQQKLLLRKIKNGFVKDENTKSMALNLLKSNNPISRLSWQMLMNVNPEGHTHSSQFILCDGKCIRVNGSKGGKNKFICNFDICKDRKVFKRTNTTKSKLLTKKRSLLRASLNIRFKPGPLSKKKNLDYSYQKHHVGETELVKLPSVGLHIKPLYGTPLEPTVKTFVQNLREEDGSISAKWAEFATSMLGRVTNKGLQIEDDNSITFNLNYKYNQKHILMRHDVDTFQNKVNDNLTTQVLSPCIMQDEPTLTSEVRDVIDRIVDSVEINTSQALMYPAFDEPREMSINSKCETSTQNKEKPKRRYGELDRLDVTVIRLSESQKKNNTEPCGEAFCALGCVCDSLECNYKLKDHCGRVDCMLTCKCDFSKYKVTDPLDDDCSQLYPGLIYLDQKINGNLSKEEQKFHQTVILTEDKSILLKSNRRNWKATKKYADFYSGMRLRSEIKNKKTLSVVVTKLNCSNIEPWCMVHNLYKCFCKGKFTESLIYDRTKNEQKHTDIRVDNENKVLPVPDITEKESNTIVINESSNHQPIAIKETVNSPVYGCSRVTPYGGRNRNIEYYRTTNKKISEMEENDAGLHAKMISIINQSFESETEEGNMKGNEVVDVANAPFKLDELLLNILQEQQKLMDSMNSENKEAHGSKYIDIREMKRLPNRTKLVQWLESSYKKYKEKLNKGLWKTSLSPPRCGKVALYPWNFILSRFRERKNLFLISNQKPFRIFMAVDAKNPYFKKCVNVINIPASQLNEYPVMVRKLLNDETDQNDAFCILCGLSHCWELVGSVTKVNENKVIESDLRVTEDQSKDSVHSSNKETDLGSATTDLDTDRDSSDQINTRDQTSASDQTSTSDKTNTSDQTNAQESKWFVMTIENDFTEIQFFKKGFFIKYDSIVRAIVVSRKFGKTVRLSSQKCNAGSSDPQFGLYAIPNMSDNYVFIGPYEKDEPLGIEALRRPVKALKKNRTRGQWITVNKVDNSEVINNPLSFMPSFDKDSHEVITFGNDRPAETSPNIPSTSTENMEIGIDSYVKDLMKSMQIEQPLKISKTSVFKLPPLKLMAKPLPYSGIKRRKKANFGQIPSDTSLVIETVAVSNETDTSMLEEVNETNKPECHEPVVESQSNIKITNISSLCGVESTASNATIGRKPEKGMFVLKPEEINERVALNYFRVLQPEEINKNNNEESTSVVENSLDSPVTCSPSTNDVYVISDDEDTNDLCPNTCNEVWISCTNVKNLGWIPGTRNNEKKISFKFPGFTCTDFYDEDVAFNKINQVFSRKVYVPKNITMKWQVIDKVEDINIEDELSLNYLNADFVLTKRGLVHKNSLVFRGRKRNYEDTNLCANKMTKVFGDNAFCYSNKISDNVLGGYTKVDKELTLSSDSDGGEVSASGDKKTDEDNNDFGNGQRNEDNVFGDVIDIYEDSISDGDNKNVLGDEEKKGEDYNLFRDVEDIHDDFEIPTLRSEVTIKKSTSMRLKKTSTSKSKKEVFERDSAD